MESGVPIGQVTCSADLLAASKDRCAECGDPVDGEWMSYRADSGNPRSLVRHFAGIIRTGPAEPLRETPKRPTREFRYPDDVGVFFHPGCAPHVEWPEETRREIAELLAEAFVAAYRKRLERWAGIPDLVGSESDGARFRACVTGIAGRRVFAMRRGEWQELRRWQGKLVELDLERAPSGSLGETASAIASLAAECTVHTERIEVWPSLAMKRRQIWDVQEYLVLENLTRRLNVAKFAERVGAEDSPRLRKYLREHVLVVKERPDKGRWQPKAWALEQVVFLSA